MKFTLSWLRDHLDTNADIGEITYALTDIGLEVEEVDDPAETLGAFTICRVIEAARHPDADRLQVCRVATWPGGPGTDMVEVQVVCGAPNARTGLIGVFAPPGTHVPGTGIDLKPGVIRGVESNGMLCSERELMLSDNHEGIIELPGDAPLGARYIDWKGLNDPVVEIAITPNRPDALGIRGIARDLAARGLGRLKPLDIVPVPGRFSSPIQVRIAPDTMARACPHFAGRIIHGVRNGPSPDWLQNRLKAVGLRPISVLVDITNYFTIALNRPLHVFDADRLTGDTLSIHTAKGGEEFRALGDEVHILAAGQTVISDAAGIQSLAGIKGGEATGSQPETTSVFLESAWWDPIGIATTGRALKISSDARYRFERGIDPAFTLPGLELATRMILDLCGGEPGEIVQDGAPLDTGRAYRFDPSRIESLIGMQIPEEEQRRILAALGFTLQGDMATPPSWRPDIKGEADLIEEVARISSLMNLRGRPLPRSLPGVPKPVLTPLQNREKAARRRFASLGYNECLTYSFIPERFATLFGGGGDAVRVENPISSEMTHLRPDLLPGLLAAASRNQARGFHDLALFEIGPVFYGGEPGAQNLQAAGLLVGANAPRDPHHSRRPVDLYDAKADTEAVLAAIGAPERVQFTRRVADWWHPGRSGVIGLGPNVLAVFGEVHPRILKAMDVTGPVMAFVTHLENVPLPRNRMPTRSALVTSDFQPVDRDFAFVVDERVEALTAVNAALGADKALIESARIFDQFTGDKAEAQMGRGKKSLALTVRLQPRDKTLTDAEIDSVSQAIIAKVTKATGGTLRS